VKKIIVLIAGLFFSRFALGQAAPSSNVISASLPTGAVQLTKDQTVSVLHKNFKHYKIPIDNTHLKVDNYYQLDGIVFSFWDFETDPQFKRSLEEISSGVGAILKRNNDTVSFNKIVIINNIKFLEYEFSEGNEISLWFQSDVNKHYQNIVGVIQLKKGDEEKAQRFLDSFLNSVHFK
jgi:hypothetical protein